LCAALFTGRAGAALTSGGLLVAYCFYGIARVKGWVDPSATAARVTELASWIWVTAAFGIVTASTAWLVGSGVEDLDRPAESRAEARDKLERVSRLRASAERARDAALAARPHDREIEAMGLLAGATLHDINNMVLVVSSWAQMLKPRATTDEVHAGIRGL